MSDSVPTARGAGSHGLLAKFRVVIKEQEPVCGRVRPCFPQLLYDPKSARISCDVAAKNPAPVVADDKKASKAKCSKLITNSSPTIIQMSSAPQANTTGLSGITPTVPWGDPL